jgi:tetratricopeptide (TPR) repeat protein
MHEPEFMPSIAEAHALSDAGRYGEALALVAGELSRHPDDAELLFARATVLFDWGRVREAHAGFKQAQARGLDRTALHLNLAWSCQLLGIAEEAESYARKAIGLDPNNAAAHFGLGTILQGLKRYPDAIASYERALAIAPDHAQAAAGIARCCLDQQKFTDAESWMRRAIELAPDNPQLWIALGVAMSNQRQYAESLDALRQAANLESARGAAPQSMVDTGFALVSTGRYDEAIRVFRKGLPQFPDPRAHGYYAFLLLGQGQLREGWAQYEFRWMQEPHLSKRPGYVDSPWAGQDLTGKTILLIAEQGAGDIIHFARFAVPLKAMGATVVLQVRPELTALAQGFDGVDFAFAPPTPPPRFDYHIHLMSLPHVLGTELATIPSTVPYLRPDSERKRRWSERIAGGGLKVGVVWAGNPKYPRDNFRSIPFEKMHALWKVEGPRYFSLQMPLKEGELEKFPVRTTLENLGPELTDFAETAAAIAQLDLVICVDTAVAHLAGALGKPVWLMLPEIGDFRWLEGREDSPWYPTMRMFRQRTLGEWDEVVARVSAALAEVVRTGSLVATSIETPASSGAKIAEAATAMPRDIARVTETRYGLMQYLPDANPAARSIAWYGEYLQPQLELLARLIPRGACVVEAGSGVGEHALALAKIVGVEGQVLSYETAPVVRQILRQNLDVNRQAGVVTLMRRSLGAPHDAAKESPRPVGDAAAEVADTVDDLLLDRLDLLKIRSAADAPAIVNGASATLWRLRPALFIDARDAIELASLSGRVREFGYRCWRMDTPYFRPGNFDRRDTDIFGGQTALALLGLPEEVEVRVSLEGCTEVTEEGDRPHAESTDSNEQGLLHFLRNLLR